MRVYKDYGTNHTNVASNWQVFGIVLIFDLACAFLWFIRCFLFSCFGRRAEEKNTNASRKKPEITFGCVFVRCVRLEKHVCPIDKKADALSLVWIYLHTYRTSQASYKATGTQFQQQPFKRQTIKMGKKNSKLKQDTIDRLTTDTYCEYKSIIYSAYIYNILPRLFIWLISFCARAIDFFLRSCGFCASASFGDIWPGFSLCVLNLVHFGGFRCIVFDWTTLFPSFHTATPSIHSSPSLHSTPLHSSPLQSLIQLHSTPLPHPTRPSFLSAPQNAQASFSFCLHFHQPSSVFVYRFIWFFPISRRDFPFSLGSSKNFTCAALLLLFLAVVVSVWPIDSVQFVKCVCFWFGCTFKCVWLLRVWHNNPFRRIRR